MRKDGGLIRNWQLQDSKDPGLSVFTGIVVEDAAGRFQPGDRMRSSHIMSIDRKKGIIETMNTIYRVTHEIVIHKKGQYNFIRISDLHPDDQEDLKKFLFGRNAPLPPGETPGNTVWPGDYRDFALGKSLGGGVFIMRILYTTDLHGHQRYYDLILKAALEHQVGIVINGADMLPKTRPLAFLQEKFIKFLGDEYFPKFEAARIHYACCLGNDDLRIFDQLFDDLCSQFKFVHNIAMKKVDIKGFEFIGYNNVPDYPFGLKDRCRKDMDAFIFPRQLGQARVSISGGWEEIEAWPSYCNGLPTIEEELLDLPEPRDQRKAIYVIHVPPAGVGLDYCENGDRPGSQAVYDFLKQPLRQPLLSLHGHLHNCFKETGRWRAEIGRTMCVQPGQFGVSPSCVIIDLGTMKMTKHGHETHAKSII